VFFTAGCAPIPAKIVAWSYFEAVGKTVSALPPCTAPPPSVEMKSLVGYLDLVERGFFVFDWLDLHRVGVKEHRAYDLVGVPAEPITLDELPGDVRALAAAVKFDLSFRASQVIDVRAHFECVEPSPSL
jgi:hypothetical protein